jgi:hypothetical protein
VGPGLPDGICTYFQTKNPTLRQFRSALELKMLVYFLVICNILQPIMYVIYFVTL